MKFFAVCLIALVALTTVYADDVEKLQCIGKISQTPCDTDETCKTALVPAKKCVLQDCGTQIANVSDYASCVSKCKSDNSKVQAWIDQYNSCLFSGLLSFFALALLALLF